MINRKLTVVALLAFVLISCGTWQKTSAVSYSSIGIGLKHANDVAFNLIAEGRVSEEDKAIMKEQFILADMTYIDAGKMLEDAIAIGEEANAAVSDKYLELIAKVNDILNQMNIIINRYLERG